MQRFGLPLGIALLLSFHSAQAQEGFAPPPVNAVSNATVIVSDTLPPASLGGLEPGDQIGVFTEEGQCAGAGIYQPGETGVLAFPVSGTGIGGHAGIEAGDPLAFRVAREDTAYSVHVRYRDCPEGAPVCRDDGRYESDRVYTLSEIERADRALPVELAALAVRSTKKRQAVLRWKTASETSSAVFEVQRKPVGRSVSGEQGRWAKVASVEGEGTSQKLQRYRYQTEALAPGRYAFRLRQVDFDGGDSFSPERTLTIRPHQEAHLASARPNPFRSEARFSLTLARPQHVTVAVFDALGRRVLDVYEGELEAFEKHAFRLQAPGLSSGQYFIRARGDTFSKTQPVTLVR